MHLYGAAEYRRIEGVQSFVGEDPSGAFGLLARHARFMTPLVYGLARFRGGGGEWRYLASVGGLVYFSGDELSLCTRRFLLDSDYTAIRAALTSRLAQEQQQTKALRDSLQRIESAMLQRLRQLQRVGAVPA